MTKEKSLPLRNILILLFVLFLTVQFYLAKNPVGSSAPSSRQVASSPPAVVKQAEAPEQASESREAEQPVDEAQLSPEAKEAYGLAAASASQGDLTAAAESLHDAVQLYGMDGIDRIYRDSRFKDFLYTRQHSDLLLILGEEPTPDKGFPPINFDTSQN